MKTINVISDPAVFNQTHRIKRFSRIKRMFSISILYIILMFHMIICVYPLIWMFINSFKINSEIFRNPWNIPLHPTLEGYTKAFTQVSIGRLFYNSTFVCIVAGAVCLILSCMVAFGIQRMVWRFNKFVYIIFLTGLMIPVHSIVLPLYTTFVKIGLNNSRWGLIIPYIVTSMPYSILVIVGFLQTLPKDIEHAAAIDGCSLFRIFIQITMPLLKSAVAAIVIFNFITMWNELFLALVIISKKELFTLPVGTTLFRDLYSVNYTPMFAFLTLTIAVSISVYFIFQNQIVAGLTAGAVKG